MTRVVKSGHTCLLYIALDLDNLDTLLCSSLRARPYILSYTLLIIESVIVFVGIYVIFSIAVNITYLCLPGNIIAGIRLIKSVLQTFLPSL